MSVSYTHLKQKEKSILSIYAGTGPSATLPSQKREEDALLTENILNLSVSLLYFTHMDFSVLFPYARVQF